MRTLCACILLVCAACTSPASTPDIQRSTVVLWHTLTGARELALMSLVDKWNSGGQGSRDVGTLGTNVAGGFAGEITFGESRTAIDPRPGGHGGGFHAVLDPLVGGDAADSPGLIGLWPGGRTVLCQRQGNASRDEQEETG